MADITQFFGGQAFNPNDGGEVAEAHSLLPPGEYTAQCEEEEVKANSKGTGTLLALKFVVLEGPHKGRKVFDNINIAHQNPLCVEIAMKSFRALGQAVGLPEIGETSALLGKVCVLCVKVDGDYNKIQTYKPYANVASVQSGVAAPAVGAPAPPPVQGRAIVAAGAPAVVQQPPVQPPVYQQPVQQAPVQQAPVQQVQQALQEPWKQQS
jgi:hypothetical protein